MIRYIYDDGGREEAGYKGQTGDCIARAIAIYKDVPYKEVYKDISNILGKYGWTKTANIYAAKPKENARIKNFRVIESHIFKHFRLERYPIKGTKPTYSEAAKILGGNCLVTTRGHISAIKEYELRDTFDSRTYQWEEHDGEVITRERKAMSIIYDPNKFTENKEKQI